MAQLHEILAIEGDLRGEKNKIRDEAITVFSKKPNLFLGMVKTLRMFDAEREQEEPEGSEIQEVTTTVPQKLSYVSKSFIRFWDAKLQKEAANQEAKADVIVEETVFAKNVPVSFLLSMEEELKNLRTLYDTIPTLQPETRWVQDLQKGEGYWKTAYITVRNKTEKAIKSTIIVPATKEHPAQVREWSENIPVGAYSVENRSGMIPPVEKSLLLGRIDTLLRAFKKARQRANNQEVKNLHIGKAIFDYIHTKLTK